MSSCSKMKVFVLLAMAFLSSVTRDPCCTYAAASIIKLCTLLLSALPFSFYFLPQLRLRNHRHGNVLVFF